MFIHKAYRHTEFKPETDQNHHFWVNPWNKFETNRA